MDRLILIAIAAAFMLLSVGLGAAHLIQRRRIRALAERLEEFLSQGGKPLSFSVREDSLSPLHNAAAELEYRLLLSQEHEREECRRTSDLIADISHQLKTPLSSLRLFCELDSGGHLDEQIGQIDRMERLIYSLLRLERLCADGYEFVFADNDVRRIVKEAWQSLEGIYPDRTLNIEGKAHIRCDEKWLGEMFLNLLKNACEHTRPGGSIRVDMEQTPLSFHCTVEDDGGGVNPQDLPHLFERFYRAKGQESGGAGIGLAIVREIVYRHHGTILAENTKQGLKIVINLPILKR